MGTPIYTILCSVFTDKAHINPTSQAQGRVTREQGTRDLRENIEERLPLKGIRFVYRSLDLLVGQSREA